jgi:hypothetical protein
LEKYKLRTRWSKMLSRCEDKDHPQYHDYGGRGIYVCDEWHDFNTFYSWLIDNRIEPEKQVDRIDNNGPYSPSNCRIVSKKENLRNKRNNVFLTALNETKTMIAWAEDPRCTITYEGLMARINRGWSHEDAILLPINSTIYGKIPGNCLTLTAFGETKTTSEWLQDPRCVVGRGTLWYRINKKWDHERAITKPSKRN